MTTPFHDVDIVDAAEVVTLSMITENNDYKGNYRISITGELLCADEGLTIDCKTVNWSGYIPLKVTNVC